MKKKTKKKHKTASDLLVAQCRPCEEGAPPLEHAEINLLLGEVKGWKSDGKRVFRTFHFKNYYETMAFVNAVAFMAHRQNHHPDLEVGYNQCVVNYSTHAVGGLSENDFLCAAKVDALIS